jgi:hypothetical protein
MNPPTPYKSVDIYRTVTSRFDFSSNALDYVNKSFGLGRKIENSGLSLWKQCIAGDRNALNDMVTYNRGDVTALEETYLRLLPWIPNHPNIGLWHGTDERCCSFCGSENLTVTRKDFQTPSGLYEGFRCDDCGGLGRDSLNKLSAKKRKSLLRK